MLVTLVTLSSTCRTAQLLSTLQGLCGCDSFHARAVETGCATPIQLFTAEDKRFGKTWIQDRSQSAADQVSNQKQGDPFSGTIIFYIHLICCQSNVDSNLKFIKT